MRFTGTLPHCFGSCVHIIIAAHRVLGSISRTNFGQTLSLLLFVVWPVFYLFHDIPVAGRIDLLRGNIAHKPFWTAAERSSRHPIKQLILAAQVEFERLRDNQSKTLKDAKTEYRRRYIREPPPGFEKWFAYAQSKQSVLIDDFDMINDDLKLFWQISPYQLVRSINQASGIKTASLPKCGFRNGTYYSQGGSWLDQYLGELFKEISPQIPDINFALNLLDEPRVVTTPSTLRIGGVSELHFDDESHKPTWSRVTRSCQNSISTLYQPMVHNHGIPFVQDWYAAKDICQHAEFEHMYGFFSSPATALLTDTPIPILSQAALTTFDDIMYPTPFYTHMDREGIYNETVDPQWEDKLDTFYWAGTTTGSHSVNGSWKTSHRQRFVNFVQTLNTTAHMYLNQTARGVWQSYEAVKDLSRHIDIKFVNAIQCDEPDCTAQSSFFHLLTGEPPSRQFRSRFVFDVDGNSFSGRYYTLLRSRSVVLKQTIMKEWHDERLVPWVHFIPVSLGMQEVPEIMRYLTEDEEGRRWARDIAERGRVLRKEDATVYLYRLMLELARILDPEREVEGRS
jgi:hypothetical protein